MIRDLVIFLGILIIDQVSKAFIISRIALNSSPVNILWRIVRLHHVKNDGVAFGITLGNPLIFKITSVLTVLFVFIFYLYIPKKCNWKRFSIALIAGGAVGNVLDRLLYGKVTDFILIGYKNINWPVFNFADIAVTIGIAFYLYLVLLKKEDEHTEENELVSKEG